MQKSLSSKYDSKFQFLGHSLKHFLNISRVSYEGNSHFKAFRHKTADLMLFGKFELFFDLTFRD